ncbi:MAG: glycosyl hydrolase family 88 [Spirochaetaceae bacterium]|nr:glycosyl hydrolase family 88 [Spirochaetaceae bacterium]
MNPQIIENYIDELLQNSTAEIPAWNIEKARSGRKSGWDYIDGCMIMAILEIYKLTNNKKYLDFADYYEDFRINEDGSIDSYNIETWNVDEINGAKNLFTLYELTGKEKYRKAIEPFYKQIRYQPRTKDGNFWHKMVYPNQVWLDGLYMAQPFYMEYEVKFNQSKNIDDIYQQFFNVYKFMRDEKTGLYYHCYDSSRKAFWADKKTGLSKNFWLRALGWFSMALLDTLTIAQDKDSDNYKELNRIFLELMESMIKFQDKSGMWYQLPALPNEKGNYLETSGSSIMAYCMLKGVRLGILPEKFQENGKKAFEGVCNTYLTTDNGKLSLDGICLVAGLGPESNPKRDGTVAYYFSEPIVKDDAKGVGPFLLAYSEWKNL